jgi:hypothetical protein
MLLGCKIAQNKHAVKHALVITHKSLRREKDVQEMRNSD